MKELRFQLFIYLYWVFLDKYIDVEGFYICICRDIYIFSFIRLCVFWLYICRLFVLKRYVRCEVQKKKKKRRIGLLFLGVFDLCVRSKDLGNLYTFGENVLMGDLDGRNVFDNGQINLRLQMYREFGEEGEILVGWYFVFFNKIVILYVGIRQVFFFIYRYVQINVIIIYIFINSLCKVYIYFLDVCYVVMFLEREILSG